MDNVAYITGTSRGIGRALAVLLLDKGYHVIGMSRTNDLRHPNFQFQKIDFSSLKQVSDFQFSFSGKHTWLVNNAGTLGSVKPVGKLDSGDIVNVMNVNTIAPQILSNTFIKTFAGNLQQNFHILNISSGAGKRPVTSWAAYCASKAAIDLFSETVAEELEWRQMDNWRIHSCAPGVVDTQMQAWIRSADKKDFKDVQKFVDYKEQEQLLTPEQAARKLLFVLENAHVFKQTVISVRDF